MNFHRGLILFLVGLACFGACLMILNIWGVDLGDLFYKLLATAGILAVLAGFLLVVKSDFGEHKKLKDQNYID